MLSIERFADLLHDHAPNQRHAMSPSLSRAVEKIGVIGDVHGRFDALTRAVEALRAQQLDLLVCLGDIYDHTASTDDCCRLLDEQGILTIRGNHDRWFLEAAFRDDKLRASVSPQALTFLENLPATKELTTAGGTVLICHGIGNNDLAHLPRAFPNAFVRRAIRLGTLSAQHRMVLHGHSHVQESRRYRGIHFLSVGELGVGETTGCAVVHLSDFSLSPVDY